jgi:hypothetical protein
MSPARTRSLLAGWLAVLGPIAIALGVSGLWAQRTIGDPATFAALAGEILDQPAIRTELALVIVDPVLNDAAPEVQEQREFIVSTTTSVLGDARFVAVFQAVLRRAVTELVDGTGAIRLELRRPLEWVITEVEPVSPDLADRLATVDPPRIQIVSPALADALRGFIALERTVSVGLLVAGVALVVVALLRGGPGTLLPFGATLAGASLVLLGVLLAGRSLLLWGIQPEGRADAAAAAWNIVIAELRTTLLISAAVGGLALVAGGVLGRRA